MDNVREQFVGSYYQLTEQGWMVVAVYKINRI